MLLSTFLQVTAANGSSSLEVNTTEGASSDETQKTSNGGSTATNYYQFICQFVFGYFST